jgi:hypothetical protein
MPEARAFLRLAPLLAAFVSAAVCWGLWLGEVCLVTGWAGLAWLSGFNWSALPICAVIAVTSSYAVSLQAGWRARMMFVLAAGALMAGAFAAGRQAVFDLVSAWVPYYPALVTLAAAGLAVSAGLPAAAGWRLAPVQVWTPAAVAAALLAVLPLSFMTVTVFPAFNGATDEVHAIKMGYPVLWTALLVPLALRAGRR